MAYTLTEIEEISELVQQKAIKNRESLVKDTFDSSSSTSLDGLCYVVSEALYYLTGGKETWIPKQLEHEGVSHWFLTHKETGEIFDLTKSQFSSPVPYEQARGRGFQQKSDRAKKLIQEVEKELSSE